MTQFVLTRDFKGVKADALIALYRSLNDPSGLAHYTISEIANLMGWNDGNQYLRKALASLEVEGLVSHRAGSYEITEEGILVSEQTLIGGVPASDRIVSLNHNMPEYEEVSKGLVDIEEAVRTTNDLPATAEEREQIVKALGAAQILWQSAQLNYMQVKIGILMAAEDAARVLKNTAKAVAANLLVDLIKSLFKVQSGIDLDRL
jgi:hypothetical protein